GRAHRPRHVAAAETCGYLAAPAAPADIRSCAGRPAAVSGARVLESEKADSTFMSTVHPALTGLGSGRCLVIGEVAMSHDGSLGLAHAFVDAIADAGADAVKF